MLQRLHELATFLNLTKADQGTLPAEAAYPDRVYSVEHFIVTKLVDNVLHQNDIFNVLLDSGLLYIYTNLRLAPVAGSMRGALATRLRDSMENSSLRLQMELYPAELLWAFILGGCAATDPGCRSWFMQKINALCVIHNLGTWKAAVSFCQNLPVLETSFMHACKESLAIYCSAALELPRKETRGS